MTPAELTAIEAAYAKATPGEWWPLDCDVLIGDQDDRVCECHAGECRPAENAAAIAALHNAFPALAAIAREALARREGATAYQAICSRLWQEGWRTSTAFGEDGFSSLIWTPDGRLSHRSRGHETEVAAVLAAVAERDANA